MHRFKTLLMSVALLSLVGCASVGLQPAQSFGDKLAYAYGVHTAVLQTASTEVSAGSLSSADGNVVLRLADQSRQLLDTAKTISDSGDVSTATGKLTLAVNILTQLQTYLDKHKGK